MLKKLIIRVLKDLLLSKFVSKNKNLKFAKLDQHDMGARIKKFEHILGLSKKLECKVISEKTIYIKSL